MKKIISCLLVFATVMCNTACTKSETNSDINSDTSIEIQAEMLSLKSADILMAADFSEIICIDKNGTNNLIFGKLKSGKYSGYIANDEFTENKTFYFNPQEDETVKNAALASYGKSAVLTTIYNDTYIYIFGNNGELEKTLELGEVISPDDNFAEILCCEDGYYINIDRHTLAYIDSDGNYKGDVNTKGSNICGIVKDSSDVPCVLLSNENQMTLASLNQVEVSEETNCGELADYTNAICTGKGEYRIAVIVDDGLYALKNDIWVKLTDFAENDFHTHDIRDVEAVDENTFIILLKKEDNSYELRLLSQRDISEIKAKKIVKLANLNGGNIDPYNDLIKKYNSESDNYKVEIVNYNDGVYDERTDSLKQDILSGNAPDIVTFSNITPSSLGADSGTMVDLYSLLDNDSDLSRDDFLDGFLERMETKGKLYQITASFIMNSVIIKDKYANGLTSWNIDELEQIYNNKPSDMEFSAVSALSSKEEMFRLLFKCNRYYNTDTAECSFNSSEFIRELKFINDNDIGTSNDMLTPGMTLVNDDENIIKFRNDEVMVNFAYLNDFRSIREFTQVYSDEPVTFIGFPDNDKMNGIVSVGTTYGIMGDSDNIEGAWDFMKYYFFSEEAFNNGAEYHAINPYKFCGIEKFYKQQLEDIKTPHTYIDSITGEEKNADIYTSYSGNGIEVELQPFTNEEAEKYDDFVRNAVKQRFNGNSTVNNIVWEEAGAYFAGERSAEDAAEIIQNRVNIYLSEQT